MPAEVQIIPPSARVNTVALLKAMRTRAMNARLLAYIADVPRRAVRRALEDGTATPSVVERIAGALRVPVEQISKKPEES